MEYRMDVLFYVYCGALTLNSFLLLLMAVRMVRNGQLAATCRVVRTVVCFFRRDEIKKQDQLVQMRLQLELSERRISWARSATRFLGTIMQLILLAIVLNTALGSPHPLTIVQDIIILVAAAFAQILQFLPSLVTRKTLDMFYFVFMLLLVFWASPLAMGSDDVPHFSGSVFAAALALALLNPNSQSIMIGNTILAFVSSWTVFRWHEDIYTPVCEIIVPMALVTITAASLENAVERNICDEVVGKAGCHQQRDTTSLLDSFCDCVVELDSDLRLVASAPLLDAMLLQKRELCCQGASLEDWIYSDADRAHFEDLISDLSFSEKRAAVFHTTLHDVGGNVLNIEFFSVKMRSEANALKFTLGLREYTDVPPLVELMQTTKPRKAKKRSASQMPSSRCLKGTPATIEPQQLGAPIFESADPSEPDRISTTDLAKNATMLSLLLSWYVKIPPGACCAMHAAIQEAMKTLQRLCETQCRSQFGGVVDWQCPACGIVDTDFRVPDRPDSCTLCSMIAATPQLVDSRSCL
eukprot:TRINITY_DN25773_c0_g1_i1.p1 TRINITY_DN25773_c0_g1~~TRINITY_DN25773_c0_g1_i1.p1  ORF type:complete len:525 (+),score=89.56 TRINITY_DN25773_c0_g1_i1:84-1658(+)